MALRANLADLFQQLYSRLRITQTTAQGISTAGILEKVRLTYNINELVDEIISKKIPQGFWLTISISASGNVPMFTIPEGHVYTMIICAAELITGTYELDSFSFTNPQDLRLPLYRISGASYLLYTFPGIGLRMAPGYSLSFHVGSFTASGDTLVTAVYKDETI